MSFNDLKKAIKDYVSGKRGLKLSAKQQEKLVSEFEQYCALMVSGDVRFFKADNVVGEFGWLEDYAKNEPDNKTQFKLYNVEQTTLHLIGKTYMNEDFETMLSRIESKCGNNPENETTHVGRFLAAYNQYALKYKKVASKGLQKPYYDRVQTAHQSVAEAYGTGISKMETAYDSAKKEVRDYTARNKCNIAESAKREAFQGKNK